MKIAFVQFEPSFGRVDENIARVEGLLDRTQADLAVLPELFSTGYVFTSREEALALGEEIPAGRTTAELLRIAQRRNMHIVGGICEKDGDRLYNSAVLVSPEGYRGKYRKIHLFNEEKLWFEPGDRGFEVYDLGICRVGIMICFDWFFPEAARILALKGAQIICHCANLVLPYCQEGMATRCLENRVFAVTANRTGREARGGRELMFTGKSQITGPLGQILHRADGYRDETGVVEIDPTEADNKDLNALNNLFQDRKPALYGEMLSPHKSFRKQ